jgi:hypothetical protein
MFARSQRTTFGRLLSKRLQHSSAETAPKSSFNNKYNFNINPPPVHEYWNYWNASVFFAFIPLYFGVGYIAKYVGTNVEGYGGILEFADREKSPLNKLKFAEAQAPSK